MALPPPTTLVRSRPSIGQSIKVVSKTWTRDSHDLFDFETSQLETQVFNLERSAQIVRTGTLIQVHMARAAPSEGEALIQVARQKDGGFYVDKAAASGSSGMKRLWLVVKDLQAGSYSLSKGDVIKLGCFKFRVRQLMADPTSSMQPDLKIGSEPVHGQGRQQDVCEPCCQEVDLDAVGDGEGLPCRICLMEGGTKEDPLVKPCACKGSIECVHLGCLRHWIRGRLDPSGTMSGSYYYRSLPCELCKTLYPTYCTSQERGIEPLVELPKTQGPFIVLENMMRDTQQHVGRGLHVLSLADGKRITMGRGHDNDVCIADVSTSRCHATIRFSNGKFILEDNNSKFGTLVSMKKPQALDQGCSLSIQAGRTVLNISANQVDEEDASAFLLLDDDNIQLRERAMTD